MAHVIDEKKCIGCGACASECPVGAISPNGSVYTIDKDKCIDCGNCVGVCPVQAIAPGN